MILNDLCFLPPLVMPFSFVHTPKNLLGGMSTEAAARFACGGGEGQSSWTTWLTGGSLGCLETQAGGRAVPHFAYLRINKRAYLLSHFPDRPRRA